MGIINMFVLLLIALLGFVSADKYYARGITKFHRVGSFAVVPASGHWTTYYTSPFYKYIWYWPWGKVQFSKKTGGGVWTKCVRKYWNILGKLKTVTYRYTKSRTCYFGKRWWNKKV